VYNKRTSFLEIVMTMHLCHPALSTTGKKKGKKKWATAEQKKQAEELAQQWDLLKKKYESKSTLPLTKTQQSMQHKIKYRGSDSAKIPSLDTGIKGAVSCRPTPQYTGNNILGISIVHKSCLQPVFNQEQAKDFASMRR
jgi:hypothetical protein